MTNRLHAVALATVPALACASALAAPAPTPTFGAPIALGEGFSLDPILDARLRLENVDTATKGADAVTARARFGAELAHAPSHLAVLVEGQGTVALDGNYNGLSFVPARARPAYAVVADPESLTLHRLQAQYRSDPLTVTVGRQRINLDDQRWVGASGWRQNEQVFDAVRGEGHAGAFFADATYADSQRTIYGSEAGPRVAYGGRFWFLGAGVRTKGFTLKSFAYLLDYDKALQTGALAASLASTQTYGLRATGLIPLGKALKLNLTGSYASQSNYRLNPASYSADYTFVQGDLGWKAWTLTGGHEVLGSDSGHAVQTPMATMHAWDGWADQFLTTPASGLAQSFAGLARSFPEIRALPGLKANVTWRDFHSAATATHYGDEWDASAGFKLGPVNLLAKFADFRAKATGYTSTRKFWLQAEAAF